MATDMSDFGPPWTYIDRVTFKEQRRLEVATLLPADQNLAQARFDLTMLDGDDQARIIEAFADIIDIHTEMLKQGPSTQVEWSRDRLVNLGIVQLWLERFRRPFPELMIILSGERQHAVVVQLVTRSGTVIERLTIPVQAKVR